MNKLPLISVVMSVYNTPEEYLRPAIESILNQTYTNFEFIIIDDGSTNNSVSIIESYDDERIVLIKNSENIGVTKSRNKGLDICHGEYMAVMDSDDISLPNRFEKQITYMSAHPNVIVCGTCAECIGAWNKYRPSKYLRYSINDQEEYRISLLFGNRPNIIHPTAMFNRELMLKYDICYDESRLVCLDYKMWVCCSKVADCCILPDILLYYRVHDKSISLSRREQQIYYHNLTIKDQLEELHLHPTEKTYSYHDALVFNRNPYDINIKRWIKRIIKANRKYKLYDERKLSKYVWGKWTKITYYGLLSSKAVGDKLRMLINLPVFCLPLLLKITLSKQRQKRSIKVK